MPAKVGIKSCRLAGGCVSFVYECSYPAAIVFDQTHVISIDTVNMWVWQKLYNAKNHVNLDLPFL